MWLSQIGVTTTSSFQNDPAGHFLLEFLVHVREMGRLFLATGVTAVISTASPSGHDDTPPISVFMSLLRFPHGFI